MPPDEKAKILIVDDKPGNLLALEAVLDRLGHTLVRAHSGKEALAWLTAHDFAVILLDVQMPEMDGFEVASLVRSQFKDRQAPIIFMTAMGTHEADLHRGYEAGGLDYMLKPFDDGILRSKVKVLVELHQAASEIRNENAELKALNADLNLRERKKSEDLEECGKNLRRTEKELVGLRGGNSA